MQPCWLRSVEKEKYQWFKKKGFICFSFTISRWGWSVLKAELKSTNEICACLLNALKSGGWCCSTDCWKMGHQVRGISSVHALKSSAEMPSDHGDFFLTISFKTDWLLCGSIKILQPGSTETLSSACLRSSEKSCFSNLRGKKHCSIHLLFPRHHQ